MDLTTFYDSSAKLRALIFFQFIFMMAYIFSELGSCNVRLTWLFMHHLITRAGGGGPVVRVALEHYRRSLRIVISNVNFELRAYVL